MSSKQTTTASTAPQFQASGNTDRRDSVNQVTLIGRFVAAPEIRQTASGVHVTTARVATNDKSGAEFHDVVLWGQLADFASQYLGKGRLVYVRGRLQSRTWQAADGTSRKAVEIVAERLQALSARGEERRSGCVSDRRSPGRHTPPRGSAPRGGLSPGVAPTRDHGRMLSISPDVIKSLPVNERALAVLQDLVDTKEWNEYNYHLSYGRSPAANAIAEATAWLRGHAFIARTPGQTSGDAIFVTARGHEALRQGIATVQAAAALEHGLHPLLVQRVRRHFLLGEYEQGVFVAMKAVEVRVRSLSKLGDAMVGVGLMTQAFREGGPLTDADAVWAERQGVMALFQGAYAVLRNPASHREVDYDDVTEAAEAVGTASLLMRILDRVEQRLGV